MKKNLIIVFTVLTMFFGGYLTFRKLATDQADKEIDSFFVAFRKLGGSYPANSNGFLTQKPSEVISIISRNKEAISNFSYSTLKPDLNLALNEAIIPVSWHLTIIFRKYSGDWYPVTFDEYSPPDDKA